MVGMPVEEALDYQTVDPPCGLSTFYESWSLPRQRAANRSGDTNMFR